MIIFGCNFGEPVRRRYIGRPDDTLAEDTEFEEIDNTTDNR